MVLTKNGISFTVTDKAHIDAFKNYGYVEVVEQTKTVPQLATDDSGVNDTNVIPKRVVRKRRQS